MPLRANSPAPITVNTMARYWIIENPSRKRGAANRATKTGNVLASGMTLDTSSRLTPYMRVIMDKPQAIPDRSPMEIAVRDGVELHGCTIAITSPIRNWTRPIKNTKDFALGRYFASNSLSAVITTENSIVLPMANRIDNTQPLQSLEDSPTTWKFRRELYVGTFSNRFPR